MSQEDRVTPCQGDRYRTLCDRAAEGILVADIETRKFIYANLAICSLLGYTQEELQRMTVLDIHPKDDLEHVLSEFETQARGEKQLAVAIPCLRKDGTTILADINTTTAVIDGKECNVGFFSDITCRKQAERAEQMAQRQLQDIFDNIPAAVYAKDLEGRYIFVNRQWRERTRLGEQDVIGKTDIELFPHIVDEEWDFHEKQVLESGETAQFEEVGRTTGCIYMATKFVLRDDDGQIYAFCNSSLDITEHKQAEADLHRYTERLKILHEIDQGILAAQSPEAIAQVAVTHIRRLIPCRRAGITLLDSEANELVLLALDADIDTPAKIGARMPFNSYQDVIETMRQGKIVVSDIRPRGRMAKVLRAEDMHSLINVPLISRDELIGLLNLTLTDPGILTQEHEDIARQVADQLAIAIQQARMREQIQDYAEELEQRVIARTAQLEVANTELEAFSYSVSHDLRSPLRIIDGFSEVLLDDYSDQLDTDGKDYLHRVRAASQRMEQLIDDLLKLSRTTRGEMSRQTVDLSSLADAIVGELQQTQPDRQVDFIIARGMYANGDKRLLQILLENLLGNAWKFTAKQPHARIEFGRAEIDGINAYFVRDNGAGFDMAYADRLFGVFQRLHKDDEFDGNGIGLATVQRIINRHAGRVWAEAKVNHGATFYFIID